MKVEEDVDIHLKNEYEEMNEEQGTVLELLRFMRNGSVELGILIPGYQCSLSKNRPIIQLQIKLVRLLIAQHS